MTKFNLASLIPQPQILNYYYRILRSQSYLSLNEPLVSPMPLLYKALIDKKTIQIPIVRQRKKSLEKR